MLANDGPEALPDPVPGADPVIVEPPRPVNSTGDASVRISTVAQHHSIEPELSNTPHVESASVRSESVPVRRVGTRTRVVGKYNQ